MGCMVHDKRDGRTAASISVTCAQPQHINAGYVAHAPCQACLAVLMLAAFGDLSVFREQVRRPRMVWHARGVRCAHRCARSTAIVPDDPLVLALRDTVRCTQCARQGHRLNECDCACLALPRRASSTRRTQRSTLTACRSTNAWVSWMSSSRIRSRGSPTCPSTACWACSRRPQTCWRAGRAIAKANRRSPPPCYSRWGACKPSVSRRLSTGGRTPRTCPPARPTT